MTLTLVEQMWERADRTYVHFVGPDSEGPESLEFTRGMLRGICEMIALFMPPHFTTGDEVAREVIKRYKMKQAGETYETAGLLNRRYEAPPSDQRPRRQPVAQVRNPLDEQQIKAVKMGLSSGMFTAEDFAKTYGVSVEVIRQIVA